MENQMEEMVYEAPRVEMITVEVELGFALSNVESPRYNPEEEW